MKWCVLAFLLTGCMVGPDFTPPCPVTQSEWIDESDERLEKETPPHEWWFVFEDPLLNALMEKTAGENLTLQAAAWRVYEARYLLGIAIGEFFPQVQEAVGSAERFGLSKHAPNTTPIQDFHFWDYNLGFQAAWELDFWGKFRRNIQAFGRAYSATIANYDDVLLLLYSQTAATFIEMRTIEEQLEIVRQNIALQQRSYEISLAQFRGGFVTELDVMQALSLLRDTEARIPQLQIDLQRAKSALAVLVGVTPLELESLIEPGVIPHPPQTATIGIPADLLWRRPDVRRALYEAASQCARIGVAKADFFPQVSLTGFIGWQSSDTNVTALGSGGNLFSKDSLTSVYGPVFSWPLLNYGRITNRYRAEIARFEALLSIYENTVLQGYREAEESIALFLRSQTQVEFLDESVQASERAVEVANKQYVEGLVDYTRVLNTQQALLQSQERLTLAKGNICQGLIALYKAIGGGG